MAGALPPRPFGRQLGWGTVPSDGTYRTKDLRHRESILSIFKRIAQYHPDAIAVHALCEGDKSTQFRAYSYRELDRITSSVATNIRERTKLVQPINNCQVPYICICVHEGSSLVVTNLAVLKAGAALVPVSPSEPASRLRKIIADIKPIMVRVMRTNLYGRGVGLSSSAINQLSQYALLPSSDHSVEATLRSNPEGPADGHLRFLR